MLRRIMLSLLLTHLVDMEVSAVQHMVERAPRLADLDSSETTYVLAFLTPRDYLHQKIAAKKLRRAGGTCDCPAGVRGRALEDADAAQAPYYTRLQARRLQENEQRQPRGQGQGQGMGQGMPEAMPDAAAANRATGYSAAAPAAAAAASAAAPLATAAPFRPSANPSEKFSQQLYQVVAAQHPQRNVVYSPLSLQTLLAFVYMGAEGATAQELQRGLQLPAAKGDVAQEFGRIMQTQQTRGSAQLVMANKLYHAPELQASAGWADYARNYFDADIEALPFTPADQAAAQMNRWVAAKTSNHIRDLVAPAELDADTKAILINAIYFKAKWANEFSVDDTSEESFHVSDGVRRKVRMMFTSDRFRYAQMPSIDAEVLEMPYKNSDLSMMIILPNGKNGLPALEARMRDVLLSDLSAQLQERHVTVRLPRFIIDFELDMVEPLRALGIKNLFSNNANLRGFFQSGAAPKVSQVQHKAYIEVNEAGSEAAAASFAKVIPLSLHPQSVYFTANHPFMFAIRSPRAVFFVGHVVE